MGVSQGLELGPPLWIILNELIVKQMKTILSVIEGYDAENYAYMQMCL